MTRDDYDRLISKSLSSGSPKVLNETWDNDSDAGKMRGVLAALALADHYRGPGERVQLLAWVRESLLRMKLQDPFINGKRLLLYAGVQMLIAQDSALEPDSRAKIRICDLMIAGQSILDRLTE